MVDRQPWNEPSIGSHSYYSHPTMVFWQWLAQKRVPKKGQLWGVSWRRFSWLNEEDISLIIIIILDSRLFEKRKCRRWQSKKKEREFLLGEICVDDCRLFVVTLSPTAYLFVSYGGRLAWTWRASANIIRRRTELVWLATGDPFWECPGCTVDLFC